MKNIITILLLFISVSAVAQDVWYVSPRGDDSNNGQDSSSTGAWRHWAKAFNATGDISPGDTVYFLGGVYEKSISLTSSWYYPSGSSGYGISVDGTSGNYVHFYNYPGQTPILECDGVYRSGQRTNYGIRTSDVNYVKFRGLHIRNVQQVTENQEDVTGAKFKGAYIHLDQMVIYNIWGTGIDFDPDLNDTIWVTNTDVYNCCDSLGDPISYASRPDPGNDGTGFKFTRDVNVSNPQDTTRVLVLTSCRAWQCSDQGYSLASPNRILLDSCWSFLNGDGDFIDNFTVGTGDGNGFKFGWARNYTVLTHGLVVNNEGPGIATNENDGRDADSLVVYNSTFYNNKYGWRIEDWDETGGDEMHRIFKNNIAYDNVISNVLTTGDADYTHEYNSTDNPPGVTVNDADFRSLTKDSATIISVLAAPRKSGGYLPDIGNYYKLSSTSDLIDAGDDEGYGDDLGAFQYSAQVPAEAPNVTTGQAYNISTTGCIVIGNNNDSGGGTVSQKGVCWSTSENPTTADDKTEEGAGTGEFTSTITGLDEGTTYYVRAYATNEADTSYGDNVSFTTRKGGVIIGGDGNVTFIKGKIYIKK